MRQQRNVHIACEQALRGTLEAGREKEGELATTYLEFKYLLDMLIGGDDISNETSLPLARFLMFVHIRTRFRFALIGGNLTAQVTPQGEPQGNWR